MGKPCFLPILILISAILSISISQGFGRRIQVMRHHGRWYAPEPLHEDNLEVRREMVEMVMDYQDPRANTNPRSGVFNSPAPANPPVHQ